MSNARRMILFMAAVVGWWTTISGISCRESASPRHEPADKPESANTMVADVVRVATFNVALNRPQPGGLLAELESGRSEQVSRLAEVIQRVRPDIILLNEFDADPENRGLVLFQERFLSVGQNGQPAIEYPWTFTAPVNTGVDSGMDLNGDGKSGTPDDAFGYGQFPGQYSMAVLSRFPVDEDGVRTFQNFLWSDMPGGNQPLVPDTGNPWYPEETWVRLRLASKSMWDVPIQAGDRTLHLICAHPTPPVFDGPEDRNGCRNHDEIRMVADYVGGTADYLVDDHGRRGGLEPGLLFVVVGDMNADPFDGDSRLRAAWQLTDHPRLNHSATPSSQGAVTASHRDGGANRNQQGNPAFDTADFNDRSTGNFRVDYCLPCAEMPVVDSGVFWPSADEPGFELNAASDHHLVWVDVRLDGQGE